MAAVPGEHVERRVLATDGRWYSFTGAGFPYLPDLAEAPPWVSELGTAATVLVGVAWLRSFSGCGGS